MKPENAPHAGFEGGWPNGYTLTCQITYGPETSDILETLPRMPDGDAVMDFLRGQTDQGRVVTVTGVTWTRGDTPMETAILRIAQQHLCIDTLEVRNSDGLDFYDAGVASIRDALTAAYKAGRGSAETPKPEPTVIAALERLILAAECRENTMGDPCRLIDVQAELREAAAHARVAVANTRGDKR
jgi:hypothetical protein